MLPSIPVLLVPRPPAVVAAATTTWNPSDKAASITLSGGDLIATKVSSDSTYAALRSVGSRSSGKFYIEFIKTFSSDGTSIMVGIGNASFSLASYLGGTTNSLGIDTLGRSFIDNIPLGVGNSGGTGDVRCLAIDLDNEKFWSRVNGGNWNNSGTANPATNTEGFDLSSIGAGPYYIAGVTYRSSNHVINMNSGGSAFAFSAPSGFGNW